MIDPFSYVPWYFKLFLAGTLGRIAYQLTFETAWGRRTTSNVLRVRQGGHEDFTAAFETIDPEIALNWLRFFDRIGTPARFSRLSLPVDVIYGQRTFRAVRCSAQQYGAVFRKGRVHELEGMGHLLLVRGAAQIAEVVFGRTSSVRVPPALAPAPLPPRF